MEVVYKGHDDLIQVNNLTIGGVYTVIETNANNYGDGCEYYRIAGDDGFIEEYKTKAFVSLVIERERKINRLID